MYAEVATAFLDELNAIEINGNSGLAFLGPIDKHVRPGSSETRLPRLAVRLYDERYDPKRRHPTATIEFDDDVLPDSTSVDSIPAPEPWLLFYQVDALSYSLMDDLALRKGIMRAIGGGKLLSVSYSVAGRTITHESACLYVGSPKDFSETRQNYYKGRIAFSFSIEAWLYPDIEEPDTIPLLRQRILNRLNPGTQDDTDIAYTVNLDQED